MPQPLFSVLRVLILLAASALLLFCTSAYQVYRLAATDTTPQYADAAVVLGAAAWGNKPSPVFRERISHGIDLYRRGLVGKLIFTGGTRKAGYPTEAEVGRRYALARGVPENDIITENLSANTYENLHNTRTLMYRHQLRGVILVSDPYHMARAAAIAADPTSTPLIRPRPPAVIPASVKTAAFSCAKRLFSACSASGS